ncbi:hemolysin III family protein [Corallococcus exercitus]|uniref:hemolysin III family protein n=1 Tax=Corallococcus exercitus TaxID=2316736 RepID=UPI001C128D8B|nr:hemolysin III family protein [Corallococcus exercitus]
MAWLYAGALLGILQSLFWALVPNWVTAALAAGASLRILLGGLSYTLRSLAYAFKRPTLRPGVFGYHDVFHAMALVGAALHFVVVLRLMRTAG